MNRVFVDTSAILALLVASDHAHQRAQAAFAHLAVRRSVLVTTSYNLVETYALIDRRLGREAVRAFRTDFASLLEVNWVDDALHERGLDLMLKRSAGVSLVDAVSFAFLQDQRIHEVFAFDRHFEDEGFAMVT